MTLYFAKVLAISNFSPGLVMFASPIKETILLLSRPPAGGTAAGHRTESNREKYWNTLEYNKIIASNDGILLNIIITGKYRGINYLAVSPVVRGGWRPRTPRFVSNTWDKNQ